VFRHLRIPVGTYADTRRGAIFGGEWIAVALRPNKPPAEPGAELPTRAQREYARQPPALPGVCCACRYVDNQAGKGVELPPYRAGTALDVAGFGLW
jgi:hypothetical protein